MTLCTIPNVPRSHIRERRPGRPPSGKRLALARASSGKLRAANRRSLDPCDNSNDSGLGFDNNSDAQHSTIYNDRLAWVGERAESSVKRPRLDVKLENEDVNEGYNFPEAVKQCKENTSLIRTAPTCSVPALSISSSQNSTQGRAVPRCIPLINRSSPSSAPVTLTTQLSSTSHYYDITLDILKQPEQQHRARYQTEGSRGAVKDREGNGFPVVQLTGYHKPATLQIFIGTDVGKVTPHMFYQACRVSGKNSTPCIEKKIDGTVVIELQLDPAKDMLATCDCVGILKERNVDVEHRFPDQLGSRSKKKSTRCRMIFRTSILHDNGIQETLQVCSQPIVCTQPPGIPEICKKSLTACPASGGLELFVLGKNFLKDTRVYFQQVDDDRNIRWEQSVLPDKEFLQQTHFVCVVPPFVRPDITEPVTVRLYVVSSGKMSEPHQFVFTPVNGAMPSVRSEPRPSAAPFLSKMLWTGVNKQEQDLGMMPPPGTSLVPLSTRRPSATVAAAADGHSPPLHPLKQELIDESSQSSVMDSMELRQERFRHLSESSLDVHQGDSNMSMINDNSIDMLRHGGGLGMEGIGMVDGGLENSNVEMILRRNQRSVGFLEEIPRSVDGEGELLLSKQSGSLEDYKGIDLRMKMPGALASVTDLVNTNAPSLSTLQKFGVTEPSAVLPTQSAQSIECYLTTIEASKSCGELQDLADMNIKGKMSTSVIQPFPYLNETTQSEATIKPTEESTILNRPTEPAIPINTEKLDALVNSTVEKHICIPPTTKEQTQQPSNLLITTDVMLNSQISPQINSPIQTAPLSHPSPNISPEVILNSQISPTLMCRTANDPLTLDQNLLTSVTQASTTKVHAAVSANNEAEKAILLKATVDLLQTQKRLCELEKVPKTYESVQYGGNLLMSSQEGAAFMQQQQQFTKATSCPNLLAANVEECKSEYPAVPAKEPQNGDRKNEDRMVPPVFATMTESELISIINPSCFDQGNSMKF